LSTLEEEKEGGFLVIILLDLGNLLLHLFLQTHVFQLSNFRQCFSGMSVHLVLLYMLLRQVA